MKKSLLLLVFTVGCGAVTMALQSSPSTSARGPLEGAWRIAEVTGGPAATTTPEPGFYIFTRSYYSYVRVTDVRGPLPAVSSEATPPQLLDAWMKFQANSGTYEIKGATLVVTPIVAKHPVAQGAAQSFGYQLANDVLSLTQGPVTTKFKRVD